MHRTRWTGPVVARLDRHGTGRLSELRRGEPGQVPTVRILRNGAGPGLPPQEVRKTVTIVFSDLKGSTNLGEALDPESLREVMTRYFDSMRAVLDLHGGTIEKYIGDAIMAVFGLPRLHEDDALRAVRAAHGMQQALRELNQRAAGSLRRRADEPDRASTPARSSPATPRPVSGWSPATPSTPRRAWSRPRRPSRC